MLNLLLLLVFISQTADKKSLKKIRLNLNRRDFPKERENYPLINIY